MLYRVAVRNNHFPRVGEEVTLDAAAEADWANEIARGFLVPIDDPNTIPAPATAIVPGSPEDLLVPDVPGDPDADLVE